MYDIPQNQFTNHSLQIPSFWPCVVMFQQQLYVIGTAYTDTTTFKSLQIYDPNNQSWSIGPDLHTPRSSMGCVARSDDIFVFGGQNSNPLQSVTLNSIERFWPGLLAVGAGPWFEQTARLSVNAALLRCIEFMDQIYCAGGSDHVLAGEAMNALNRVDIFSIVGSVNGNRFDIVAWKETLHLNIPRVSSALVIMNEHLYILGGYSSDVQLDTMEMLSLTSSPTAAPTYSPVLPPSNAPTMSPTNSPTVSPTSPTLSPEETYIYVEVTNHKGQALTFTFYVVSASIYGVAVAVIVMLGYRHSKTSNYTFVPLSVLKCLLYVLDFHADAFFGVNLLFFYLQDKQNADVILGLCIASFIVLISSRMVGLYEMERFITRYITECDDNSTITEYFGNHACKLYTCGLVTGNFSATLLLFSCNLFDLDVFGLSITRFDDMMVVQNKVFVINLILQDIPQLIISIIYAIYTGNFATDIVLFTVIFGVGSITASSFAFRTRQKILHTRCGVQNYKKMPDGEL